jgi:hypothetical protein
MGKNRKRHAHKGRKEQMVIDSAAHMAELAGHYDDICKEIDHHVLSASKLVSKIDPLALLQRGYGEYAAMTFGKEAEVELGQSEAIAQRMIDYIQCLIVSTPPDPDGYGNLTEEIWQELTEHVELIFYQLVGYFIAASGKRSSQDSSDNAWEEFFTKAQMNWCYIKGDRYINHLQSYLTSLLQPHDDVFYELFGINTVTFAKEIEKIRVALTAEMFSAGLKAREIHQRFFELLLSLRSMRI